MGASSGWRELEGVERDSALRRVSSVELNTAIIESPPLVELAKSRKFGASPPPSPRFVFSRASCGAGPARLLEGTARELAPFALALPAPRVAAEPAALCALPDC